MTAVLRMLEMVFATLVAMKVLTLTVARAEGTALGPRATVEFFGWPGMRPALFAKRRTSDVEGARAIALNAARNIVGGALLFVLARAFARGTLGMPATAIVVTLLAMPALSLMLHFGLFDLVAAGYRLYGVPVDKLFRAPLRSRSLAEFWSRRWNLGYSEMIALVVHRPLRRRFGANGALFGSFLVSGLLHELAISVPVHAGYGLPTAYFLLHGALVGIERRLGRTPGRLWTMFWLVAPLPLLFHIPFLRGVVWPLAGLRVNP